MPDHLHLIAHMGCEAIRLGQWIKALKAIVGGLEPRPVGRAPSPGTIPPPDHAGRVPSPGLTAMLIRTPRSWHWQEGFHDHKFRTPEGEARKWEYVCLNPVRYHLVRRPEDWPYGGEIFYGEAGGPELVRGTPPLLECGILIEKDGTLGERSLISGETDPGKVSEPPGEGTRPTGGQVATNKSPHPKCPSILGRRLPSASAPPVGRVPSPGAVSTVKTTRSRFRDCA